MSNEIKDGGSAFPIMDANAQGIPVCVEFGMSLRDYFAAKVLCGWPATYSDEASHARASYRMADAMLKAREVKS